MATKIESEIDTLVQRIDSEYLNVTITKRLRTAILKRSASFKKRVSQ